MISVSKMLQILPLEQVDLPPRVLYHVVPTTSVGLTVNNEIVTGLKIEAFTEGGFSPAEEHISNLGNDADFIIPADLKVGDILESICTNLSRDWESGMVDDWDVEFVRTTIRDEDLDYLIVE